MFDFFHMNKVGTAALESAEIIGEYSQNNNGVNISYQNKLLYSCTTVSNPFLSKIGYKIHLYKLMWLFGPF